MTKPRNIKSDLVTLRSQKVAMDRVIRALERYANLTRAKLIKAA